MPHMSSGLSYLGVECGATHSVAIWTDDRSSRRLESGPANLRLLSDPQLIAHLRAIARQLPSPSAIAIGMAGARTAADRRRITTAAARLWPDIPCHPTHDLATALATESFNPDSKNPATSATVLVLSGTGSCCYGKNERGETAKVGGWGHLLGDQGSGYDVGLSALKCVIRQHDERGAWPPLGERLLRALQLNEPDDLVGWIQNAQKPDVAQLSVEVFRAADEGDRQALSLIRQAADRLAEDAMACAGRLAKRGEPVTFLLAGGVLLKQSRLARSLTRRLRRGWPAAHMTRLSREGAWGAVALAKQLVHGPATARRFPQPSQAASREPALAEIALASSPTEQRNPRSRNLDRLATRQAIRLMLSEEAKLPPALLRESDKIERAIQWVAAALRRNRRLFYVGAGTSGRLGVLDASECPPTFQTRPEQVQAIMAGGARALWTSVEGAEDDRDAGARAVQFRGVTRGDVVIGIAASGRTPFVWGALEAARKRGAKTILLCFNPNLRPPSPHFPDLIIAPDIGPEVLTGSTRLKAGTATKLVLNLVTTLAMVRLGKVLGNWMIDVHPSNSKLRARAIRIVQGLSGAREEQAAAALEKSSWNIRSAWALLKRPGRGKAAR